MGGDPDSQAAIDFLKALEPRGPWLLVAINPNPKAGEPVTSLNEFNPGDEEQLRTWLDRLQGKWNLYFTSNLPKHAPFTTSKKIAIEYIRVLHVDVDLPGSADDPTQAEHLLNSLRLLSPPPTVIVFTGGGYQAIWILSEKLPPERAQDIEAVNTVIWRLLKGDHCHDISRLLRLPGTINVPNQLKRARGRVPTLSYVVEADWSRSWSFDDPIPNLPDDHEALPDVEVKRASGDESGAMGTLPPAIRKLIQKGDASNYNNDRSRLCWRVMCDLIRRGWSDEDIIKILLDKANQISAHYLDQSNPRTYIARNLVNARAAVALDWKRDPNSGAILTKNQENIDKALNLLGIKISHDALADRVWLNGVGPARRLSDEELDAIWLKVQKEYGFLPDQAYFTTVFKVRARENSFHPVLEYLTKVQPTWDGEERIGSPNNPSWLTRYGGVEDTPFTRAAGRLTLVAAVRRMRSPGCKFDEMLMLVDPTQGSNKSTAVRTLAVNEDWFNDYLPIGEVGREVIEHVRGFWIIEAQELAGMSTRDVERIKGFCSRQTDKGRMSYDRLVTDLPRSCIFIGTTNEETLFTDLQNRRYWPVLILHEFDIDRMKMELNQLWAEAAQAEAQGESIRLDRSLWPAAAEVQSRFRVEDQWATLIDHHLGNMNGRITSIDLYKIINKQSGAILHADGRRLGRAMREIGFERKQLRDGNSPNPRWYYLRGPTPEEQRQDIYVYRDPMDGRIDVSYASSLSKDDVEAARANDPYDVPF